jgi:hypothetical protein
MDGLDVVTLQQVYRDGLLTDTARFWFARAVDTEHGGLPGKGEAYGFVALRDGSGLLALVNPDQTIAELPLRLSGGAPPNGKGMGELLIVCAEQDGRAVPVEIAYDKAIWSGLSWAVGEVDCSVLNPGQALKLVCESKDARILTLEGAVYQVKK